MTPVINQILAKAEATGSLGSSATFNQVINELGSICTNSNFQQVVEYLQSLDCSNYITNVESLLRSKSNL